MIETKISSQKFLTGTRRKNNIPHDEKGFAVFVRLTVTPLEITNFFFRPDCPSYSSIGEMFFTLEPNIPFPRLYICYQKKLSCPI